MGDDATSLMITRTSCPLPTFLELNSSTHVLNLLAKRSPIFFEQN